MKLPLKPKPEQTDSRRIFYAEQCEELTEQLNDIRSNFDFVTDPQAIDSLIYAENSVIRLIEKLIRSAREEGITIQMHERGKKHP